MLFFFDHLEVDRRIAQYIPKKFRASKLLNVITKWQQGLEWNAVYMENHDQPRIVSHYGAAERDRSLNGKPGFHSKPGVLWQRSAKMLALFQLTLRGTLFIYQGQEIGMTNFDFKSIDELNDVVSHGFNNLMKRFRIPANLRWKWIKASSRDNARTPMQWEDSKNAGFSKSKPWLGVNSNYKYINYASQKKDTDSILNFYKKIIALRKNNKCLIYGDFFPIYADDRLMIYQRKLESETYTIVLNFSSKNIKVPKKFNAVLSGTMVSASGEKMDYSNSVYSLLPWDGVLIKNN